MRYLIRYKNQEEQEVTKEEYIEVAKKYDSACKTFASYVPKMFIGAGVIGYVDPEVLKEYWKKVFKGVFSEEK